MSSLKDLARECGVSVATVSKALNGQSDISAATRDRVREAARRMGYVPNMAARAMKTNRTYNLGVLFVDERQSGLAHEYFSAVLDSFKVQVEKLGYDITFVNRNLGGRTMTYLEHCHYRGVDGAVIACVDFNDPQVVELVNSDVPVVTIDMCSTTGWRSFPIMSTGFRRWCGTPTPTATAASPLFMASARR